MKPSSTRRWREARSFLAGHHDKRAVVFDIPLLFERGGHEAVDVIVVVSAPEDVQRARVLARPGMTEQKFEHICGLQLHDLENAPAPTM